MARYMYRRDIITRSSNWVVPVAKEQEFLIKCWGAGGAGSLLSFEQPIQGSGGGSGEYKEIALHINANENMNIVIGKGGKGYRGTSPSSFPKNYRIGEDGTETKFDRFLTASGGKGGNDDIGGLGGDSNTNEENLTSYYRGNDGGSPGCDGEGRGNGYGMIADFDDSGYLSGGGGDSVNSIGVGGNCKFGGGDATTASGGCGAYITSIDSSGIHIKTGSGGDGMVIIEYYAYLGE